MLFFVMLLTSCQPNTQQRSGDILASPESKDVVDEAVAEKPAETEVAAAGDEMNEHERTQEELDSSRSLLAWLASGGSQPHVLILDDLTASEKLRIEHVDDEDKKIGLTGSAVTEEVLYSFMRKLEDSAHFTNVVLIYSRSTDVGHVMLREFFISVELVVFDDENPTASLASNGQHRKEAPSLSDKELSRKMVGTWVQGGTGLSTCHRGDTATFRATGQYQLGHVFDDEVGTWKIRDQKLIFDQNEPIKVVFKGKNEAIWHFIPWINVGVCD